MDSKEIGTDTEVTDEAVLEEAPPQPLISAVLTCEDKAGRFEKTPARLYADALELDAHGNWRRIKLSDIVSVSAEQYRINIELQHETIVLSMLGHLYEDFAQRFVRACNEVFFAQSLMREAVHYETRGEYIAPGKSPEPALFRICETALVILPDTHALVRIPFCLFASTHEEPYRFTVTDTSSRVYVLQKLGRQTDKFLSEYRARVAQIVSQTRERLMQIAPVSDGLVRLMMEGLVVPLKAIRAESAAFANALEAKLNEMIPAEYTYIKSVCVDLALGIKRGLMGELTGENIVLLGHSAEKGRAIVESLGASAATYVFRTDGQGFAEFLPAFNESMLAVNFRREPIYLSDEALGTEKYEAYRYALMRCAPLAGLRARFVGRAAHSGFEAWKRALGGYLDKT